MNQDDLHYTLDKLGRAFDQLRLGLELAVDDLGRDGAIQRFEYTFELLWKTVKVFLEYEGFACAGPRSCLQEGSRRGFLVEGDVLLDMLVDRNKTTHLYNEDVATLIFQRVKNHYADVIAKNLKQLRAYLA